MGKNKIPESAVLRGCLDYLHARGVMCWRNNTGAFKPQSGGFVRYGMTGSADIIGICKDGRFLAVECKCKGGCPSAEQLHFQKQIKKNGGVALIVYSVEELIRAVADFRIADNAEIRVLRAEIYEAMGVIG